MVDKKITVIKTKTYTDSVYSLKNSEDIVAVEKKVNKLLENPHIAKSMMYQDEGFCEIQVGKKIRVYCIKLDDSIIIVFVMGFVDSKHDKSYKKSKEYEKIFSKLREARKEFKFEEEEF